MLYTFDVASDIVLISMLVIFFFFFFKQKTAYEMRISDWSSDVCSSDLEDVAIDELLELYDAVVLATGAALDRHLGIPGGQLPEIGRASCRERVCQYV